MKNFLRRAFALATLVLATGGIGMWQPNAHAQGAYPNKPIRVITYVPVGSGADAALRALLGDMGRNMGVEFIVQNRPGGGGTVAASAARGSAPDGYTLLIAGSTGMISALFRDRNADPFAGFVPVSQALMTPTVLSVRTDLGVQSMQELIEKARAQPGKISYATAGVGSYAHFMMELLGRRAGVQFLHVAYPQMTNALSDAIGGRIDGLFTVLGTTRSQVEAGRLRSLGITGERRAEAAPTVPTFVEIGYPDISVNAWNGVFAPAGTPAHIIDRLATEFIRAGRNASPREAAMAAGVDIYANSAQQFAENIRKELAYWGRVMDETGISPQ